ncbi:3-methylcrotonyl-CoA carboxylase subunit alpha [Geopyxis carbonaria]|nr:3-methylcrotonyl-CoA carboxylase subunit alpha [Geopyxis carbonaria]
MSILATRYSRPIIGRSRLTQLFSSSIKPAIKPIKSILIANRGEIALRVSRTASEHCIKTTTVFTEVDSQAPHARFSPYSVNLGPVNGYLDVEKIITAAKRSGCDAVHPGYGFLSENSYFAKRCIDEGIIFIGPSAEAMEAMGNKSESKTIMLAAGVPCVPGYHGKTQDSEFLLTQACKIGFPVLIKAVKGGGGKGMRIVSSAEEFPAMLQSAKSESVSSFGDDSVLVEKYIATPRHIEVQIFADQYGDCVALGERDCSVQRRHQKIIEESPAPFFDEATRQDIWKKAREAALAVKYTGAGTVEFIFDNATGKFYFMEMNTRLQVEHPVTEMVSGVDLVHWQILIASGRPIPLTQEQIDAQLNGHAFEARIYAENPDKDFMPDSGKLIHLKIPEETHSVRVDAGFRQGDQITTFYDPMIAKLIVKGTDRDEALKKLRKALEEYEIVGPSTNIEFLKSLSVHPAFVAGEVETGFINKHRDKLFYKDTTPIEVYTQAALSILARELAVENFDDPFRLLGGGIGFTGGAQTRRLEFNDINNQDRKIVVDLEQCGGDIFNIAVEGKFFSAVEMKYKESTQVVSGLYPHTRIDTTVISNEQDLHIFHQGKQYQLRCSPPLWLGKELEHDTNSVIAPMPCKVLRLLVSPGDQVGKGQPIVVIESMKMETEIRSPQEGIIWKLLHIEGVSPTCC